MSLTHKTKTNQTKRLMEIYILTSLHHAFPWLLTPSIHNSAITLFLNPGEGVDSDSVLTLKWAHNWILTPGQWSFGKQVQYLPPCNTEILFKVPCISRHLNSALISIISIKYLLTWNRPKQGNRIKRWKNSRKHKLTELINWGNKMHVLGRVWEASDTLFRGLLRLEQSTCSSTDEGQIKWNVIPPQKGMKFCYLLHGRS